MYATNLGHIQSTTLALFCCIAIFISSTTSSFADVAFELVSWSKKFKVKISGTISKEDASQIASHEAGFEYGLINPEFDLNSLGGDVEAAMLIGRIIRRNELVPVVCTKIPRR
jgi:hypothetical protein